MRTQAIAATATPLAVGVLVGAPPIPAVAQDEKPDSSITPAQLAVRILHRRAVIGGMPAVNMELMFHAVADAKAGFNQVVCWSKLLSWKNQTLTPNPDTVYLFPSTASCSGSRDRCDKAMIDTLKWARDALASALAAGRCPIAEGCVAAS